MFVWLGLRALCSGFHRYGVPPSPLPAAQPSPGSPLARPILATCYVLKFAPWAWHRGNGLYKGPEARPCPARDVEAGMAAAEQARGRARVRARRRRPGPASPQ